MLVPKLLLTPIKIRIFGPKTAKIGPKSAFLVILGQILPFLHILSNARPKNNVNKVPRWVFRYVGNKTFDFSSKKRIFCPKTTKFGPKLAFLVNLGQAMQAYSVPCWWVGWWLWRAGCISQDTYLLYCTKCKYDQYCDCRAVAAAELAEKKEQEVEESAKVASSIMSPLFWDRTD